MKKILPWLFIGLILRLFLIPHIHPDLRGFNYGAYLISQKGELLSFYDHLSKLPRSHQLVRLYHDDLFIYPPMAYITPALFMKLLTPLYPWPVFDQFIYDLNIAITHPQITYLVYLLKIPYLVIDFACLLLLRKLVPDKSKFLASLLWIFNPVTLYSIYIIGQFDISIALFTLLSLYLASRKNPNLAAVSLGIAAAFKPFPLFFLPFLSADSSVSSRIKSLLVGVGTYLLIVSPYLSSAAFRQYAFLADHSQKILYAKIMVSATAYLSLFLIGLGILAWFNHQNPKSLPMWAWFGSLTLLFYSVAHFHPQWFVWGIPFLIISYATYPQTRLPITGLVLLYFAIILTFEPSLNSDILRLNFSPSEYLSRIKMADTVLSALKSLFAATSVYLLFQWKKMSQS